MPLAELVQHDSPLGRWQFARWRPLEPLASYIDELWHMRSDGSYIRERLLPRPHMDLLINLGDPHRLMSMDSGQPPRLYERAWIAGLQDRYLEIEAPSNPWLMGIRFKPSGPLALLRVPLDDLTNQVVDIDLILGPSIERLRQRLVETPSLERRFQLLERHLVERVATPRPTRAEISYALDRLARTRGAVRVRRLATETGLSQKHLIHLFREQVGLTPKRYARIVRLNALLKQMSAPTEPASASASAFAEASADRRSLGGGRSARLAQAARNGAPRRRPDWADLAVRFGYYDQAHFVREFREFTGTTPTGFLRSRGPDGDSVVLDA